MINALLMVLAAIGGLFLLWLLFVAVVVKVWGD